MLYITYLPTNLLMYLSSELQLSDRDARQLLQDLDDPSSLIIGSHNVRTQRIPNSISYQTFPLLLKSLYPLPPSSFASNSMGAKSPKTKSRQKSSSFQLSPQSAISGHMFTQPANLELPSPYLDDGNYQYSYGEDYASPRETEQEMLLPDARVASDTYPNNKGRNVAEQQEKYETQDNYLDTASLENIRRLKAILRLPQTTQFEGQSQFADRDLHRFVKYY